jgi:hypothetical protein
MALPYPAEELGEFFLRDLQFAQKEGPLFLNYLQISFARFFDPICTIHEKDTLNCS